MGNDLLKQYENGELTEEEVVNRLFFPWEQIDQSQHHLLTQLLQTASGGIPTPHVGTGSGGSYNQSYWDGLEHDPPAVNDDFKLGLIFLKERSQKLFIDLKNSIVQ